MTGDKFYVPEQTSKEYRMARGARQWIETTEEDTAAEHQHDLVHVSRHSAVCPLVHLELLESQTAENQGEDVDDQDGKLYLFSLRPVIGEHIDARTRAAHSCPEEGERRVVWQRVWQ